MKEETTPTAGLQVDDIKRVTPLIRALYLGQKVFESHEGCLIELKPRHLEKTLYGYLLLRPLSSITDDEAVHVAKLSGFEGISSNPIDDEYLCYKAHQYLIQHGFAFDYYDSVTNTTITVDMQVAAGIIKLKS